MADHRTSIEQTVQRILLTEWDPIGIKDFDGAQDEYDSYVRPLCDLIFEGASEDAFYRYLLWAEVDHMGLPLEGNRASAIAKKLFSLSQR
ncbi:hypothetical protein [Agrobacterium sp. 22117]|uniref:hypothetical protein n=1 Tax=Agrobacterium sp. 22117 TaxID=3453880 RepID=UPI003F837054